ncbi:MAG TPA: FimV/HubP family polar landmark protein [Steroidobacteraceae bacterium]|nr:FimV/HubP family polar landmark protein [Steroidobacteraceae bacterium]
MSRGQNPLVLMMALSLPGAAHALGLGEIHVNSALNEPLAADIEILGATAEELSSLTASIANRDTFRRFGAERLAFLASATFKVSHDVKGRPLLLIRSTDSFTEPLVNLLVDLRWHGGEVIRQYSLLLDPAGFPAATQVPAAVNSPVVPAVAVVPAIAVVPDVPAVPPASLAPPAPAVDAAAPAAKTARTTTHIKIGAKATLRGVAWRVGARSDSDLKKTMLAIFRANPNAFEGNINRLRRGAVVTIPSAADISTISTEDANREIHAQMTAWSAASKRVRTAAAPVKSMVATASTEAANAPHAATKAGGDAAEAAALDLRLQSLERELHDMQGQLQREHDRLLGVQAQVRNAAQAVNDPVAAAPATRPWLLPSLMGGLGLLAGALGAIYLKLRRRARPAPTKIDANSISAGEAAVVLETSNPTLQHVVAVEPVPRETPSTLPRPAVQDTDQVFMAPNTGPAVRPQAVLTVNEDELRAAYEDTLDLSGETAVLAAEIAAASDTANLPAATVNLNAQVLQAAAATADEAVTVMVNAEEMRLDTTKLDYNLVDLDLTAQHVHLPSVLHQPVVVKERRTNLVDVLRKAVEREPDRRDLRMKLLETYYAAAAANRQAFLEVVQKLARDRDRLDEGEWDKIALMGRQIAGDTALFSSDAEAEDDNKLADCA